MSYTIEEKVQMIKWIYSGTSYSETQRLFTVAFEGRPTPARSTILRLVRNFESTGSLVPCRCRDNNRRNRGNEETEAREISICAAVEQNSSLSSRQVSEELGYSSHIVKRTLKKNGYKSYKISVGHQLLPHDTEARMIFCEQMTQKINADDNFLSNVLFGDESSFPLLGRHNPSVVRFWSRENPRRRMDKCTQYPQKLNVWAGMLGNFIIGPFFIGGNLTGNVYLNLLRDQILPAIRALPGVDMNRLWFQHDGCPAHSAIQVKLFLDANFPNRLITNGGTIHWPARSPDLAPNDFTLWGTVKQKIYTYPRATTLEELREKISAAFGEITPGSISNTRISFYNRLAYCTAVNGDVFEHLLS